MSVAGFMKNALVNAGFFWLFYLGPVLTLPLVTLPWILRDRRLRFLVVTSGIVLLGLTLDLWFLAHYAAPATCLLYVILVQCLRHLRHFRWRGRHSGVLMARGVPAICVLMLAMRIAAQPFGYYLPPDHPATWCHTKPGNLDRAKIIERLNSLGERYLVLVRYGSRHNWFAEWVYNEASIDTSKVVWAHDMGEAGNRELLEYFKDRRVWLIEPDIEPPKLSRYPGAPPHGD